MKSLLISAENEIRVEMTITKYMLTRSPVSVSDEKVQANRVYFYHFDLFLTTKNNLFTSDYIYSDIGYRFWRCNFGKVYTFLQEIVCLKKLESRIFTEWI